MAGFLLLVASGGVWWWNEARVPEMGRAMGEAARQVVSIAGERADPANNGRLVHLTGLAESRDRLVDPLFGIEEIAIALIREVEMFQWHERSRTVTRGPGSGEEPGAVYSYKPEWSGRLIDSNAFVKAEQHSNPAFFPVRSETWRAENVVVGAFQLNADLIRQIEQAEPVTLAEDHVVRLPERFAARADLWRGDWLYVGDPVLPGIGDVRIRLSVVRDQPVSILARQIDNTFEPHFVAAGAGIMHLVSGVVSNEAMLEQLGTRRSAARRVLQIGGVIGMLSGVAFFLLGTTGMRCRSPMSGAHG